MCLILLNHVLKPVPKIGHVAIGHHVVMVVKVGRALMQAVAELQPANPPQRNPALQLAWKIGDVQIGARVPIILSQERAPILATVEQQRVNLLYHNRAPLQLVRGCTVARLAKYALLNFLQ